MARPLRALALLAIALAVAPPCAAAGLQVKDVQLVDADGRYFVLFNVSTDASSVYLYSFFQSGKASSANCTAGEGHRIMFERGFLAGGGWTRAVASCPGALDSGSATFTLVYQNYSTGTPELVIARGITVSLDLGKRLVRSYAEGGSLDCVVGKGPLDLPVTVGRRVELTAASPAKVAYLFTDMSQAEGDFPLLMEYGLALSSASGSRRTVRVTGNRTSGADLSYDCADGVDSTIEAGNVTVVQRDIDCVAGEPARAVVWVGYRQGNAIFASNGMAGGEHFSHLEYPRLNVWRSFHRGSSGVQVISTDCLVYGDTVVHSLVMNATHLSYLEGTPRVDVSRLLKLSGRLTSARRELKDGRLRYTFASNYTHVKYGEEPRPLSALPAWLAEQRVEIVREVNGMRQNMTRTVPTDWPIDLVASSLSGAGRVSWSYSSARWGVEYNLTTDYLVIPPVQLFAADSVEVVPIRNNTLTFTLRNELVDGPIRLCTNASSGWHSLMRGATELAPCIEASVGRGNEATAQLTFWSDGSDTGDVEVRAVNARDGYVVGRRLVSVGAARFKQFSIDSLSCDSQSPASGLPLVRCDLSMRNEGNLAELVYFTVVLDAINPSFQLQQLQMAKRTTQRANQSAAVYTCSLADGERRLLAFLDRSLFFCQLASLASGDYSLLAERYTEAFGTTKGLLVNVNQTAYDSVRASITAMLGSPTATNAAALTADLVAYKRALLAHLTAKCELAPSIMVNATALACSEDPSSGCRERTVALAPIRPSTAFNLTLSHPELALRLGASAQATVRLESGIGVPVRFALRSNDACARFIGAVDVTTEPVERFTLGLNITSATDKSEGCTFTLTAHPKGVDDAAASTSLKLSITKEDVRGMRVAVTEGLSGQPGQSVDFYVNVTNTGNVEDTYDVLINGTGETVLESPIARSLKALAYQALIIPFSMPLPDDAAGTYTLSVKVSSQAQPSKLTETRPLAIRILRPNIVVDIPPALEKGSTIVLRNNGTAPASFKLTLEGELKNCLNIRDSEYKLAVGDKAELKLEFRCSVGEMDDKSKSLTLGIEGGKGLSYKRLARLVTRTSEEVGGEGPSPGATSKPTARPAATQAAAGPGPSEGAVVEGGGEEAGGEGEEGGPVDLGVEPTPFAETNATGSGPGGSGAAMYLILGLGAVLVVAGLFVAVMMQKESARKAAMKANLQKAMTSYGGQGGYGQQYGQQGWQGR